MQRTSPNAATEVADQSSSQCVIVSYWYQKLCVSLSNDTLTYCDGRYRPLHTDIFTQLPCVSMWQLRRRIIVLRSLRVTPTLARKEQLDDPLLSPPPPDGWSVYL